MKEVQIIQDWIDWKNQFARFSYKFNQLPNQFKPEQDTYEDGLYMQGLWAMSFMVLLSLFLVIFLILRLKWGYFGGRQLKITEYTLTVRWLPGTLSLLSLILFITGSVCMEIANTRINAQIKSQIELTQNGVLKQHDILEITRQDLIMINLKHANDIQEFNIQIDYIYSIIENVKIKQKMNQEFNEEIEFFNFKRYFSTRILFFTAIAVYVLGYISFSNKEYWLGFFYGLSLYILIIISLGVMLVYSAMLIGSCDFCEEILKCTLKKTYPIQNYGLGKYYPDFVTTSRIHIIQQQYEIASNYERSLDIVNQRIRDLYHRPTTQNIQDLENPYTYDYLTNLWTETAFQLSKCDDNLSYLYGRSYMQDYCMPTQSLCASFINNVKLGMLSLGIWIIGFTMGAIGGLLSPRVFQRWKKDESQLILGRHNLYKL